MARETVPVDNLFAADVWSYMFVKPMDDGQFKYYMLKMDSAFGEVETVWGIFGYENANRTFQSKNMDSLAQKREDNDYKKVPFSEFQSYVRQYHIKAEVAAEFKGDPILPDFCNADARAAMMKRLGGFDNARMAMS